MTLPTKNLRLFLCGDVMTGRGIDQALTHSAPPILYERYVKDARAYLRLAEKAHGPLSLPLSYAYLWGDALEVWKRMKPDLKLINLETSLTAAGKPWPGKGIHYRMHPKNVDLLTTAGIDFAALANNHILDWGYEGLSDTLHALSLAGLAFGGAGLNLAAARKPVVLNTNKGRVIILSCGSPSSGIPQAWAAGPDTPGLYLLSEFQESALYPIQKLLEAIREAADLLLISIHWGGNWGWLVPEEQQRFAHVLVDQLGADLIYGHSSHHPKGMEVYRGKLIIYGAGDFINDYEGIRGYEQFRDDLTLMYFPRLDAASGQLLSLNMVPMQISNFQLRHASRQDASWLVNTLNQACTGFGCQLELQEDASLILRW